MKVPACAEGEEAFSQCWKYSTAVFYSLRGAVCGLCRVCQVVCVVRFVKLCALRIVRSFSTDTNRKSPASKPEHNGRN